MRVGFVGLGKLGLPVAYAIAAKGIHVYGHDPVVTAPPDDTSHEEGLEETIQAAAGYMHFCGLADVVNNAELLFVAVQTPHEARFEGVTPLPEDRADFDYSYLRMAVQQIVSMASALDKRLTVAVISTVLPGTMEREIRPLLSENVALVYNPAFIAMGTTIRDFLDPEFVLIGGDRDLVVTDFYSALLGRYPDGPMLYPASVEDAELIKVAYNTFIGLKIAFANTLMEVCHKTGCDVDEVTGALKLADRRLVSSAYMDGGMGDGGACHPRDNIALSWLARELDLSHDLFEDVMVCREDQARWLADLMCEYDLPKAIIGRAYKPGSRIETGSPALLVEALLKERGHEVKSADRYIGSVATDHPMLNGSPAHVVLVGCKHPEFADLKFPPGSKVIDPFRYIPDQEGVEVVRLGAPANDREAGARGAVRQAAA